MSLSVPALAAEVLGRLAYLAQLRNAALAITRIGVPADRLRASELAALVAAAVDAQDSPWFRRDLTVALRAGGWRSVRRDNVRLWMGVRFR